MTADPKNRPFDQRFNEAVHDAANRLDRESEKLIDYINDEVVPAVRTHSSRGLRIAAEKFRQFADFLEKETDSPPDTSKR